MYNEYFRSIFQKFELILVDDGSPDNSGLVCDYYSNIIDNRTIKYFERLLLYFDYKNIEIT